MYALVPSCMTFASTNSNLLLVVSDADMKYFQLLCTVLSNWFSVDVADVDNVVVPSAMSE